MQRVQRKPAPVVATARQRTYAERTFVLVLTAGFVGLALAFSAMQVQGMFARSRSKEVMASALEQLSQHQNNYRTLYGRFATWPELAERGERVAEGITVVQSNATESHWYVQLHDPGSGLVCDRIHELGSEGNEAPERNTCREAVTQ